MKLPVTVPAGWATTLKLAIETAINGLRSTPSETYPTTADLPQPNAYWNRRTVIVAETGSGPGLAFCLNGAWFVIPSEV